VNRPAKTLVLGIDPGISIKSPGAMALVDAAGPRLLQVQNLPLAQDRKGRPVLNVDAFELWLSVWADRVALAVIEDPNSHGQEGRSSLWRFAQVCAQIPTVCRCLKIRVKLVKPCAWKALMGLSSEKKASIAWARGRFPDSKSFERIIDHGRAEATALAVLGVDRFLGLMGMGL
jgi:hypothetical protein